MTVREVRDALNEVIKNHPQWADTELSCGGGDFAGPAKCVLLTRYDWTAYLSHDEATDGSRVRVV